MTTSTLLAIPVTDILKSASAAANPTAGMASQFAQAMQAAPLDGGAEGGAGATLAKAIKAQDLSRQERSDRMGHRLHAHFVLDARHQLQRFGPGRPPRAVGDRDKIRLQLL